MLKRTRIQTSFQNPRLNDAVGSAPSLPRASRSAAEAQPVFGPPRGREAAEAQLEALAGLRPHQAAAGSAHVEPEECLDSLAPLAHYKCQLKPAFESWRRQKDGFPCGVPVKLKATFNRKPQKHLCKLLQLNKETFENLQ